MPAAIALLSLGCSEQINFQLKARNELNKGVRAFQGADYQVRRRSHSARRSSYDPDLTDARAYQAYAYMNQYIPGGDFCRRNRKMADAGDRWV